MWQIKATYSYYAVNSAIYTIFLLASVIFPLPHGVLHGENLTLETRTGFAGKKVGAQCNPVGQLELAIFSGYQQVSNLLACAS